MQKPKKISEAGKAQLVAKAERIIGEILHFNHMAKKKGIPVGAGYDQTACPAIRSFIEHINAQR